MVLQKIKSPITSSSPSMKSSSSLSSSSLSSSSSAMPFSSPASVLKLNDLQSSSAHSIASFNVRDINNNCDRACSATTKVVRLDVDIDDDDAIDAETQQQQEHQQTQLVNDYYRSSSSSSSDNSTTSQRAQKAVPFPLPPFLDDVTEEHSSSSSNIDLQCDDTIATPTAATRSTSSASTFTSTTKRSVSFSLNLVETHEIVHHHDMDEEEKHDRWYRKKEWKKLRREGRITARLMENQALSAGVVDHEELGFCTLGLKQEPHPYAREKQLHKMLYKDLLMSEQDRQLDVGINDPDMLAEMLIQLQNRCRHTSFVSSLRERNTSPGTSSFRPSL